MGQPDAIELVTVATFSEPIEADLCRQRLESEGLNAVLADTHTAGMLWHYRLMMGGAKVQVPFAQADRARDIVRAIRQQREPSETQDQPDLVCPVCRSGDLQNITPTWSFLFPLLAFVVLLIIVGWIALIALTVIPLLWQRRRWRCCQCGHVWRVRKRPSLYGL
jgi:hypothetical protein